MGAGLRHFPSPTGSEGRVPILPKGPALRPWRPGGRQRCIRRWGNRDAKTLPHVRWWNGAGGKEVRKSPGPAPGFAARQDQHGSVAAHREFNEEMDVGFESHRPIGST
jgi:hypothetical protein